MLVDRELLSKEHAELDALAQQLLAKVRGPVPVLDGLSTLRWRLNRVLIVHLAKEDKLLYPALSASSDPSTRLMANHFAKEMGGLAAAYLAYATEWTIEKVEVDWSGFGLATRKIMRALRQRIQREEMQLYPRIIARAA